MRGSQIEFNGAAYDELSTHYFNYGTSNEIENWNITSIVDPLGVNNDTDALYIANNGALYTDSSYASGELSISDDQAIIGQRSTDGTEQYGRKLLKY